MNPTPAKNLGAAGALQWAELLRVVHILPGRVRLRLRALRGDPGQAAVLRTHLGQIQGIHQVEVNHRTGSLLVHYEPRMLSSPAFLDAFAEAMGSAFPGRFAPGRISITLEQVRGNQAFAETLNRRLAPIEGIDEIRIDAASGACLIRYDSRRVTTGAFLREVAVPLEALLPGLDVHGLLAKAGFRPR
jgi:hypothetical protein